MNKKSAQKINYLRKRLSIWIKNKKIMIIILLIIFFVISILISLKVFLLFKLALGYDTVVKLDSDKEYLFLKHGEFDYITYKVSVTTNPFCKAVCNLNFIDISNNSIINQTNFTLRATQPFSSRFIINSPNKGSGLKLYRADLYCVSKKGNLCNTKEQPSTRSILLTVDYGLNDEEKVLEEKVMNNFEDMSTILVRINEQLNLIVSIYGKIQKYYHINNISYLESDYKKLELGLYNIKDSWETGEYYYASLLDDQINELLIDTEIEIEKNTNQTKNIVSNHNQIAYKLSRIKSILSNLGNLSFENSSKITEIKLITKEFIEIAKRINKKSAINEKVIQVDSIYNEAQNLKKDAIDDMIINYLTKYYNIIINNDILCNLTGKCLENISINEILIKDTYQLNEACMEIERLNEFFNKTKIQLGIVNINMSDEEELLIQNSFDVIKKRHSLRYISELFENDTNTNYLKKIINDSIIQLIENTLITNETEKLLLILEKTMPKKCNLSYINLEFGNLTLLEPIEVIETNPTIEKIRLIKQERTCCIFNNCEKCCVTADCVNNNVNYPIILLHGHAIDKSSSSDFSLEGYEQIQQSLEKEGIVNYGTISLFTKNESNFDILSQINVPFSIRTTYYIDVFKTPENYVAIQVKSENIDTYAIRLKELIDVIKLKTGRSKVNIIAFSMGGLVSRRYLQIFGDNDVNKVILIGTPNHGIEGSILRLCGYVGENLECRDMDKDSLFINKLNRGRKPSIPIMNIVGTGCKMDGGLGDGVVLEKSAMLDWAQNVIIKGDCPNQIKPLHLLLRDIKLYPQVYDEIINFLKE